MPSTTQYKRARISRFVLLLPLTSHTPLCRAGELHGPPGRGAGRRADRQRGAAEPARAQVGAGHLVGVAGRLPGVGTGRRAGQRGGARGLLPGAGDLGRRRRREGRGIAGGGVERIGGGGGERMAGGSEETKRGV